MQRVAEITRRVRHTGVEIPKAWWDFARARSRGSRGAWRSAGGRWSCTGAAASSPLPTWSVCTPCTRCPPARPWAPTSERPRPRATPASERWWPTPRWRPVTWRSRRGARSACSLGRDRLLGPPGRCLRVPVLVATGGDAAAIEAAVDLLRPYAARWRCTGHRHLRLRRPLPGSRSARPGPHRRGGPPRRRGGPAQRGLRRPALAAPQPELQRRSPAPTPVSRRQEGGKRHSRTSSRHPHETREVHHGPPPRARQHRPDHRPHTPHTPHRDAVLDLRRRVRGDVHSPGDESWDQARMPWIVSVDQQPLAVLEAHDEDDVLTAVRWARDHDLRVAAQPVGHGASSSLAGAMADTVLLRTRRLDSHRGGRPVATATVGAGVKGGELCAELDGTGLTFLCGSNADPTVVGMTITGGISWFGRAYGLGADSIVSLEVVDGLGRSRRVSADEDPELFWALRGGGGDFAIITRMEVALHPAPSLYGGRLLWPATRCARSSTRSGRSPRPPHPSFRSGSTPTSSRRCPRSPRPCAARRSPASPRRTSVKAGRRGAARAVPGDRRRRARPHG